MHLANSPCIMNRLQMMSHHWIQLQYASKDVNTYFSNSKNLLAYTKLKYFSYFNCMILKITKNFREC